MHCHLPLAFVMATDLDDAVPGQHPPLVGLSCDLWGWSPVLQATAKLWCSQQVL